MAPSGVRPPSRTPSAASDPDAALALSVDLGVRLRPTASIRSMASTGPGGSATLRPRSARIPTPSGRIPTSRLLPCRAGPATCSRPSTSARAEAPSRRRAPRPAAPASPRGPRAAPWRTAARPGRAPPRSAARTPRRAARSAPPPRRPTGRGRAGCGAGSRRRSPRSPSRFPSRGRDTSTRSGSGPRTGRNGPDSVTSPRTGRPASVASSGTTALGARPRRERTSARPARRHSGRWDLRATHCPSLEWGSVATRGLGSGASPATTALKLPKSAWQAPTGHSSSRQPSPAPAERASRQSPTKRRTVEWDPSQPRSETSLS